jgi:hypothetical protein
MKKNKRKNRTGKQRKTAKTHDDAILMAPEDNPEHPRPRRQLLRAIDVDF